MAEAICPGTCGELLQGWISGSEKLISCPINMYSRISIDEGIQKKPVMPLIEQATALTLSYLGIDNDYRRALNIEHSSDLPVGKGYASSTADISATIVALSRHLNITITPETIARIACTLEPSDSVMFSGFALIDHNNGNLLRHYPSVTTSASLLILEPQQTLLTKDFHRIERHTQLLSSQKQIRTALQFLERGITTNDMHLIGRASTISATENQRIVPSLHFRTISDLVEQHDLFGVCLAHSGSIIGILYDEFQHDIHHFLSELTRYRILDTYSIQRRVKLIAGGVLE